MPGKYTANDNFLTLNVNGKSLNVKVGNNKVLAGGLKSGKAYTFSLTLGKADSTIGDLGFNVTINDWGASDWDEKEHGGTAEEVK